MKNTLFLFFILALVSCTSQKHTGKIQSVTALTEVFGDGQKTTAAIVEYDTNINSEKLDKTAFSVEGRTIINVYANTLPEKSSVGKDGKYVFLELSKEDDNAATFIQKGRTSEIKKAVVSVKQLRKIETADGKYIEADGIVSSNKTINLIVDDFTQHKYLDAKTGKTVNYNLFVPKDYDRNKSYPLVLFIHDAGVTSTDTKATLVQGLGAVVWAGSSEQAKRECFVLAPQYATATVNDNSEATEDLDATVNLISELTTKYHIDRNRIYTTGQSMGCMSSIALNIKYPDLFAASLLVAGQWDASKVSPMVNDKLWIIVSEGDLKAFPGMNAITETLEKQGAKITRATWNGRATPVEFAYDVQSVLAQGNSIQYTPLKKGTVVSPGMKDDGGSNHICTWRIAYGIEGVRDWLFKQSK